MSVLLYISLGLLVLYFLLRRKPTSGVTPPGPRGWPFIGIAFELSEANIHLKLSEYARQFGDIFKVKVFGTNLVVLNSSDLIRSAFNDEQYRTYMNDRAVTFFGERTFYGSQGIGTTQHAFESVHGPLRKAYVQAINAYGEGKKDFETKVELVLKGLTKTIETYDGREFDFMELIKHSLASTIAAVLGSKEENEDDFELFWKFDEQANFFFNLQVDNVMQAFPFLRFIPSEYKQRYEELAFAKQAILQKYFHEMKASYKDGVIRGLVDHLIEEQLKSQKNGDDLLLTDEKIHCLILETILAGTNHFINRGKQVCLRQLRPFLPCSFASSTIQTIRRGYRKNWTMLLKEIEHQRLLTNQTALLPKLCCSVLLETLRFLPVGPLLFPHLCRPRMNFEGYDIDANSLVIPNIWYIHHDEKIWKDPWTFRPERFLDSDGQILSNDHPYRKSWLPFGTGRRHCLGESFARSRIFLFVATLLQRWTFIMDDEKLVSCDPRKGAFTFKLLCTPKHYKCKVVPRK